jgi:predicted XRE-type DNA-binding protein
MKKYNEHYIDEQKLDRSIKDGSVDPVYVPQFASLSDIAKYHYCNLIVKYKKSQNLRQKDIALLLGLNKSEVSKLFSYKLKEFSQERILGFVEELIKRGARINLSGAFVKIEKQSKRLQNKLEKDHRQHSA